MGKMIEDRVMLLREGIAEGITKAEWLRRVKGLYDKNKWLRAGIERIERDPWKMLRDYGDRWRARQPQYESPWEKRGRRWQDFQRRVERTIEKQKYRGGLLPRYG